jgi:hypothetical protein
LARARGDRPAALRGDQRCCHPWASEPAAPSEAVATYVQHPELVQARCVRTRRLDVGDGKPATRAKHPHRLVDCRGPTWLTLDVVDGKTAQHHIECGRADSKIGHVAGDEFNPRRDSSGLDIRLCREGGVPGLIGRSPEIDADDLTTRCTRSRPSCRTPLDDVQLDQRGASSGSSVERTRLIVAPRRRVGADSEHGTGSPTATGFAPARGAPDVGVARHDDPLLLGDGLAGRRQNRRDSPLTSGR